MRFYIFMISDRAPSECSWDSSNDDELRGSFSTDGDGKPNIFVVFFIFYINDEISSSFICNLPEKIVVPTRISNRIIVHAI